MSIGVSIVIANWLILSICLETGAIVDLLVLDYLLFLSDYFNS